MKNVLVTGSTGFIGRALTEDLLKKGIRVCGISRSETSPINHPLYSHVQHDVRDPIKNLFGFDTVFHLASYSSVDSFWENPNDVAEIILTGTMNTAKFASRIGAKFFYASSYGAEHIGSFYSFRDCYDVSKRAMETYVGDYPSSRLKAYIMRIPSVYGVGMPVHENKVVSNFIRYALTEKLDGLFVFPDNDSKTRNYIEIGELIKQIHNQLDIDNPRVSAIGVDLTSYQLFQSIVGLVNDSTSEFTIPKMEETIDYFRASLV